MIIVEGRRKKEEGGGKNLALSEFYSAFQINKPHRHEQNMVGTLHGKSLLWSKVQENCCIVENSLFFPPDS
ncbi:hypothetical protein [Okeania sp. KiyG1]|uniref:hypothetical protein n=1 Tax=Okeania sp. KiyG1 TaxID=2720165 RepID=UPI0019216352|nr:hypothetical protein [Okeania sp. KiyG1]